MATVTVYYDDEYDGFPRSLVPFGYPGAVDNGQPAAAQVVADLEQAAWALGIRRRMTMPGYSTLIQIGSTPLTNYPLAKLPVEAYGATMACRLIYITTAAATACQYQIDVWTNIEAPTKHTVIVGYTSGTSLDKAATIDVHGLQVGSGVAADKGVVEVFMDVTQLAGGATEVLGIVGVGFFPTALDGEVTL